MKRKTKFKHNQHRKMFVRTDNHIVHTINSETKAHPWRCRRLKFTIPFTPSPVPKEVSLVQDPQVCSRCDCTSSQSQSCPTNFSSRSIAVATTQLRHSSTSSYILQPYPLRDHELLAPKIYPEEAVERLQLGVQVSTSGLPQRGSETVVSSRDEERA